MYLGAAPDSTVQPMPGLAPDQPIGSRPLDWPANPGPVQGSSAWSNLGSAVSALRSFAGTLVLALGLVAIVVWLRGGWSW